MKPGDLASGARRTEKWHKETHVTTIKRGGGARKNTRAHESEEHTRARILDYYYFFFVVFFGVGGPNRSSTALPICLRHGPRKNTQWVRAASGWQLGYRLELEPAVLCQRWVPFQPAIHAHDMPWQHDHFRAIVLGLQTILTSAVLMIASSEETQPHGCSEPAAR